MQTCREAVVRLAKLPGLRLNAVSPWFESEPIPPAGQPPYVNGVASLSGAPSPERLLAWLQEIEAEAGRRRGAPDAARTLDLDIVAMGDLVRASPDPVLPHPRAHLRAFVLRPLADVAPGWRHPALNRTVEQLLDDLPPQRIARIA